MVVNIYTKATENRFLELFVIREKSFCKAAHIYLGEFWYDLERASQISRGTCPIRAVTTDLLI